MEMYPFQLVSFIKDGKKDKTSTVDCVPLSWLDWDIERKVCLAKFMPPPYTQARSKTLNTMIERQSDPDPDWPLYPIEIRGQAKTYSEAMIRLTILKKEKYAYTSESDLNHEEKTQQLTKLVCMRKVKENAVRVKNLMQVPTISSASESESATGYSGQNSDSSDEASEVREPQDANGKKKTRLQTNRDPLSELSNQLKPCSVNNNTARSLTPKRPNRDKDSSVVKKTKIAGDSSEAMPEPNGEYQRSSLSNKSPYSSQNDPKSNTPRSIQSNDTTDSVYSTTPRSTKSSCSSSFKMCRSKPFYYKVRTDKESEVEGSEKSAPPHGSNIQITPSTAHRNNSDAQDIKGIKTDIQTMKSDITEIKNVLKEFLRKVPGVKNPSFQETYKLNLPLASFTDFQSFNYKLTDDKDFRADFVLSLLFYIDSSSSVTRNITCILKKFLSRSLAMEFTACKVTAGKKILKETPFCDALIDSFKTKSENAPACNVSEKFFLEKLGQVLGNSRDWDGRRDRRKNIQPEAADDE